MITNQLFRKFIAISYLFAAVLSLSSCTKDASSNPKNIGEEYGASDPGWR
ncbi:hypothetical protein LEAN103870_08080 [Legionella anisa]|nr:hypothetical protein [Legionella anisa]MCW8424054.1 hypothetical protein [Legionella anisa]MCW8447577.1 hypothetical protein [Legionella anisa]UAK80912.1 hypothetical protein K8O89_07785 [Legionella anisa]